MVPLKIQQYVVGMVATNCYFAINDDTKEVLILDAGDAAKELAEKVKELQLIPRGILLTHGHFDHAMAALELSKLLHVKVYAHEAEKETLENPSINLSGWEGRADVYHAEVYVKDEEVLELAGFQIKVLFTPGHTIGGCCYYFAEQNTVFSGDTLFEGSIGRTDFPKGSASQLIRSIKDKLMVLPDETAVYAGHGEMTSIGRERVNNPFL